MPEHSRTRLAASIAAAVILVPMIAPRVAAAEGDPVKGRAAYVRQCLLCHAIENGAPNGFGPNLFGIFHKPTGAVPGFAYSQAFQDTAGWEWTTGTLGWWISSPATVIPGSAMGVFQGVADRDRDDIVAYLAQQR